MKVLLLTHKPDIDGITPAILSKIVFSEFDYLLLEASEASPVVAELISLNYFDNYDLVYITDLSINLDVCEKINADINLSSKIKIFDHHNSHLFVNDFEFGTSIDIDKEGNRQSGTSLYFKYLINNYDNLILRKQSVNQFVELVRQYDTWEWFDRYNNIDAKRLSNLFDIFGADYFINYFYTFLLNNDKFYYTDKELYLLEVEQEKINRCIEEKSSQIIPVKLLEHNVGIVFSENYRSELGNALARKFENEYDFIIVINLSRGISYRGIKNIDLGQIASAFGGKGHINSSGSPIRKELKKEIIEKIFNDKVEVLSEKINEKLINRVKNMK
jgi:oligoribonuclease NrnB/cAMP/cGMP phosphodiesterase (DHH superfamily)